ncbi:hypothetical protein SOM26_00835 [Sphingomonas sp. CFBP8993]|nr:hypothetical protein [Sphingomonas sp. CFBP8993]MDY0957223.1 hypothetical protein [Sphingomonas sp. CFBP8993]
MPVTGGYIGTAEDAAGMTVDVTVRRIDQDAAVLWRSPRER